VLRSIWGKTIWEHRRALMWWAIGLAVLVLVTVVFYPSIKSGAADYQKLFDQMPEALKTLFVGGVSDIGSPIGYVNSQFFTTNVPVLLLVFAIGGGSRAIAGEEEHHTLDLLLSTPIARRAVVLQKFAAMAAELGVLSVLLWVGVALGGRPFELDVPLAGLTAATAMSYLFALAFGALALMVGSARGRRAIAIGIASAAAVVAFLLNSLAPLSGSTKWLRFLSPFYYANGTTPLLNGFDAVHALVLVGATAVLLALAIASFERRDLRA
jgi:ABC-2 type transport system permease protein